MNKRRWVRLIDQQAGQLLHGVEIDKDDWYLSGESYSGLVQQTWQGVITMLADHIGRPDHPVMSLEIDGAPHVMLDRCGNTWRDGRYEAPHQYLPDLIPHDVARGHGSIRSELDRCRQLLGMLPEVEEWPGWGAYEHLVCLDSRCSTTLYAPHPRFPECPPPRELGEPGPCRYAGLPVHSKRPHYWRDGTTVRPCLGLPLFDPHPFDLLPGSGNECRTCRQVPGASHHDPKLWDTP